MSNEELQTALKLRMATVKNILQLHDEGKTSSEISVKTRVAESYVVEVLKKGYDNMLLEISEQYGITSEDTAKEKSSLKKEDKAHQSTNQEFLCMDCTEILTQIEDFEYNNYKIRMYRCDKCKKVYPHPVDSQKYFCKE